MRSVTVEDQQTLDGFVVIEGIDGAGTTTQLSLLRGRLETHKIPSHCTSEPTDGNVGRLLRDVLAKRLSLDPRTIALLFAADRNEHLFSEDGICKRVSRGELVVSDRYLFSSLTYQGIDCGMDYVHDLNRTFPLPEVVIYLDTPLTVSQSRLSGRGPRELFDAHEFQSRVVEEYENSFRRFPGLRVERIDGSAPADEIGQEVWNAVRQLPIIGL